MYHSPLRALSDEVARLLASGTWTEVEFRRILAAAKIIEPNHPDSWEFAFMPTPREWILRARSDAELGKL